MGDDEGSYFVAYMCRERGKLSRKILLGPGLEGGIPIRLPFSAPHLNQNVGKQQKYFKIHTVVDISEAGSFSTADISPSVEYIFF